jgi:hypothetical protein
MNFNSFLRTILVLLLLAGVASAQQRPLLTEDPRLIAEGMVVAASGFGYQHRARFPVSGLTGDLYSFLDSGLHFGLGKRAELQMTGVLQNYLRLENGAGSRNDWGDLALSTKIRLADEGHSHPAVSFRPTVVLPNASGTKGIGTDTMQFFGNLLFGKQAGPAYLFGNIGLGILDDPTRLQSQQDFLTYGIAASIPAGSRVNLMGEWNGRHTSESNPTPGGESRGQARLGLQITTGGIRWDAAATAGTTHWDHKAGFVAGISKEFRFWH